MDWVPVSAGLAAMVLTAVILLWYRRFERRRAASAITDPEAIERYLVARRLAGSMRQAEYTFRMARIAAVADLSADGESAWATAACRGERRLLRQLGDVLPALPTATLVGSVNLARYGARVDDLVRLMGITRAQAVWITTMTPEAMDHQHRAAAAPAVRRRLTRLWHRG
ncbi:MAG TPA: hypothetical protein VHF06_10675 [Pseudonocardiaceae bacterium]|nr:hypothetical protein [Pseudonocardiaceae bacterium]